MSAQNPSLAILPLADPPGTASRAPSAWSALMRWRPVVFSESLLLILSLYFTLACNLPFWRALLAGRGADDGTLTYALAVGIALPAVHFLMFALLLGRWTTKPLLAALILVAASASHFAGQFSVYFDPGMLRNVLQTDVAEARELLTPGLLLHVLALALPPLLVLQRLRLRRRSFTRALALRAAAIVLAALAAIGALGSVLKDFSGQMRNHKELRYLVTPLAPLWSLARVVTSDACAATAPRRPVGTDARLGASWQTANKPALFVIVVGESARAASWALNRSTGQWTAHDTTPELARHGVINFPTVTSCGTNTEVSVPCMFSMQGRRNYDEIDIRSSESLLDVLRRAGLRALLRDNHGNLVLVLHQLGNHGPAYFRRHPDAFRRFTPTCDDEELSKCSRAQIVNSYDNALLYTDHVLGRTIDLLKSLEDAYDTALLYVSDHGESLGENGIYLHGLPYAIAPREQTQVPMVMWLSSGYAARNRLDPGCLRAQAEKPVAHDNLFHTVLGLLDVATVAREDALDLAAACRNR